MTAFASGNGFATPIIASTRTSPARRPQRGAANAGDAPQQGAGACGAAHRSGAGACEATHNHTAALADAILRAAGAVTTGDADV